jgi:transposase
VPRPSKYPEQFREDAVDLVRSSDRPLRQIARELGVNHETLRGWSASPSVPPAVVARQTS